MHVIAIFHYREIEKLSLDRMFVRYIDRFTVRTWHSVDGHLICTMWTRGRDK